MTSMQGWIRVVVEEKVGVVEGAERRGLRAALGVVHSESDRRRDADRDDPRQRQRDVDAV